MLVEGSYDNDYSKIALALTAAQLAKSTSVKEFGIGEDLSINFFGWEDDSLAIVCQIRQDMMKIDPEERLGRCAELCNVIRRYWGVTSITMVAEGYCSANMTETEGLSLSIAFLDSSLPVKECITVTNVTLDERAVSDGGFVTTIIAVPYSYELGRTVKWSETLIYTNGGGKNFRNSKYPQSMRKALKNKVVTDLPDEAYEELRSLINANGFHIQEFY